MRPCLGRQVGLPGAVSSEVWYRSSESSSLSTRTMMVSRDHHGVNNRRTGLLIYFTAAHLLCYAQSELLYRRGSCVSDTARTYGRVRAYRRQAAECRRARPSLRPSRRCLPGCHAGKRGTIPLCLRPAASCESVPIECLVGVAPTYRDGGSTRFRQVITVVPASQSPHLCRHHWSSLRLDSHRAPAAAASAVGALVSRGWCRRLFCLRPLHDAGLE